MKYLDLARERRAALVAERDVLVADLTTITTDAEGERRDKLTADEERQFRAAKSKLGRIDADIAATDERIAELEAVAERQRNAAKAPGVGTRESAARFGRPLGEHRFADLPGAHYSGDTADAFGEYLRASVTKDWGAVSPELRAAMALEQRAQYEAVGSAGGYLVPRQLSADIWDMARARMVTQTAGTQMVPFSAGEFGIPRQTADATPTWRAENDAIGEDSLEFALHRLTPRTLSVLVKASRELVEDVPSLGDTVRQSMANAFALEVDRAVLNGSGVGEEPLGIRNTSGIGSTSSVGSPTWADLVTAVKGVRGNNEAVSAIVLNTRDEATLTTQVGTSNDHYLAPPDYIAEVPRLESGQVSTTLGGGGNESFIVVGDFAQSVLGVRTSFELLPLVERYADYGQVAWVGWARVDVAVMRPAAFHLLAGVTA